MNKSEHIDPNKFLKEMGVTGYRLEAWIITKIMSRKKRGRIRNLNEYAKI